MEAERAHEEAMMKEAVAKMEQERVLKANQSPPEEPKIPEPVLEPIKESVQEAAPVEKIQAQPEPAASSESEREKQHQKNQEFLDDSPDVSFSSFLTLYSSFSCDRIDPSFQPRSDTCHRRQRRGSCSSASWACSWSEAPWPKQSNTSYT